jgi:hypothetical protein
MRLQHDATAISSLEAAESTVQPLNSSVEPAPDNRKVSSTDKNPDKVSLVPKSTNSYDGNAMPMQRFIALQEGLKSRFKKILTYSN